MSETQPVASIAEPGTSVTSVIRHRPKPDASAQYEAWLKEILPESERFPGRRGANIIRPSTAGEAYTIVLQFDTLENLRGWLASDVRRRLIETVKPLLAADENIEIRTGLEFWFTPPPGRAHAKPYKQFLVTLSAIFPLTVIVPWALKPVFAALPFLGLPIVSSFVVALIVVGLMAYLIMPRYTRLVAGWLYR